MFRLKFANSVCNRIASCGIYNLNISAVNYSTPGISLSKAKKAKTSTVLEKKSLPVEEDANKLIKYVCGSNILKEGTDVELKPDSEYPEWLWTLHTGKPKTLEELDPNTIEYWKKVRAAGMRKKNMLTSIRKY